MTSQPFTALTLFYFSVFMILLSAISMCCAVEGIVCWKLSGTPPFSCPIYMGRRSRRYLPLQAWARLLLPFSTVDWTLFRRVDLRNIFPVLCLPLFLTNKKTFCCSRVCYGFPSVFLLFFLLCRMSENGADSFFICRGGCYIVQEPSKLFQLGWEWIQPIFKLLKNIVFLGWWTFSKVKSLVRGRRTGRGILVETTLASNWILQNQFYLLALHIPSHFFIVSWIIASQLFGCWRVSCTRVPCAPSYPNNRFDPKILTLNIFGVSTIYWKSTLHNFFYVFFRSCSSSARRTSSSFTSSTPFPFLVFYSSPPNFLAS